MPNPTTAIDTITESIDQTIAWTKSEGFQRFYFPHKFKDMKKHNLFIIDHKGNSRFFAKDYLNQTISKLAITPHEALAYRIDNNTLLLYDKAIINEFVTGEISETELIESLHITGLYRSKEDMDHGNGIQTEAGSLWCTFPDKDFIRLVDKDFPVTIHFDKSIFDRIV